MAPPSSQQTSIEHVPLIPKKAASPEHAAPSMATESAYNYQQNQYSVQSQQPAQQSYAPEPEYHQQAAPPTSWEQNLQESSTSPYASREGSQPAPETQTQQVEYPYQQEQNCYGQSQQSYTTPAPQQQVQQVTDVAEELQHTNKPDSESATANSCTMDFSSNLAQHGQGEEQTCDTTGIPFIEANVCDESVSKVAGVAPEVLDITAESSVNEVTTLVENVKVMAGISCAEPVEEHTKCEDVRPPFPNQVREEEAQNWTNQEVSLRFEFLKFYFNF